MNYSKLPLLMICSLLLLACGEPRGGDGSPPAFGAWIIGDSSGSITWHESGGFCGGTWTFPADSVSSSNIVRVLSLDGDLEYTVSFEGVDGSPYPDGLTHTGKGFGEGGEIYGQFSFEKSGLQTTVTGTYDDTAMEASWTMTHHAEGEPGGCTVEQTGSGSFTASRLVSE